MNGACRSRPGASRPTTRSWLKGGFGKLDIRRRRRPEPALVRPGARRSPRSAGSGARRLRDAAPGAGPACAVRYSGGLCAVTSRSRRLMAVVDQARRVLSADLAGKRKHRLDQPWTLTPSAINSWVGDELRTIGGESNVEWRYGTGALGLTGAVFGCNDPTGTLLADRGWAFDSRPIGFFGQPRRPDAVAQSREQPAAARRTVQGNRQRPGCYLGARAAGRAWPVDRALYDNRADPAGFIGNDFGWRTKFTSLGSRNRISATSSCWARRCSATPISSPSTVSSQHHRLPIGLPAGRILFRRFSRRRPGRCVCDRSCTTSFGPPDRASTAAPSPCPAAGPRSAGFASATELIQVDSSRASRVTAGLNPTASELQVQLVGRIFF